VLQLETRPASGPSFTISLAVHAIAIAVLLTIRFAPAEIRNRAWHVALLAPPRELPSPATKIEPPRVRVFRPIPQAPQPVQAKVALEALPVMALPRPVLPVPETPRIAVSAPMKTDNLTEARATPARAQPKLILEPAGFSTAERSAPVEARTAPSVTGAFDAAASTRVSSSRTAIRSGAFSEAAAEHAETTAKRFIQSGAFGDTIVAANAGPARREAGSAATTPVEIQFKPKPVYSAEAQRLRIEGEVELEIVFEASGTLRVLRVVRGLGHGLDENAMAAARGIRFRPAQSGGRPIDSTAVVHIVFQLAY
jgi:TonB family protein